MKRFLRIIGGAALFALLCNLLDLVFPIVMPWVSLFITGSVGANTAAILLIFLIATVLLLLWAFFSLVFCYEIAFGA